MFRKLLLGLMMTWTFTIMPLEAADEFADSALSPIIHIKAPPYRSQHPFPDGLNYERPKLITLCTVNLKAPNCIGKNFGTLKIDKDGNFLFGISGPGIKELTSETTTSALGKGSGPETEGETKFWTYNVLSLHSFEPNIYHVDVELADLEGHWKRYRVRGYQITNSSWKTVK